MSDSISLRIAVFCLMLFQYAAIQGQTIIYSESFNGGIPANASLTDSTGGGDWVWTNSGTSNGAKLFSTTNSDGYMMFDSDGYGNDATPENAELIIGPIDCSGQFSVHFTLDQWFSQFVNSKGTVYISNDGINWSTIISNTSSTPNPHQPIRNVSTIADNEPTVFLRFQFEGHWDNWWMIDDLSLYVPFANDVVAVSIDNKRFIPKSKRTLLYTVYNSGPDTIRSLEVAADIGGFLNQTDVLNNIAILPFSNKQFAHSIDFTAGNSSVLYDISIQLSLPNGVSDPDPSDNTVSKSITAISKIPERSSVLEYVTSVSCGYCPFTNEVAEQLSPSVIPIAIHLNDIMEVQDGKRLIDSAKTMVTKGTINRTLFPNKHEIFQDTSQWSSLITKVDTTPVSIDVITNFDTSNRNLEIEYWLHSYGVIPGDWRMNCWIIESQITGGSAFTQKNDLSGDNDYNWHPLFSQPDTLLGYPHNNVLRFASGDTWGTSGVINTPTTDGNIFNRTVNVPVPLEWDHNQLSVVVVAQEYGNDINDRQIHNAVKLGINDMYMQSVTDVEFVGVGNEPTLEGHIDIQLFPNPASSHLFVLGLDENTNQSYSVYDINGRLIIGGRLGDLARNMIDVQRLQPGYYFLHLEEFGAIPFVKVEEVNR